MFCSHIISTQQLKQGNRLIEFHADRVKRKLIVLHNLIKQKA